MVPQTVYLFIETTTVSFSVSFETSEFSVIDRVD